MKRFILSSCALAGALAALAAMQAPVAAARPAVPAVRQDPADGADQNLSARVDELAQALAETRERLDQAIERLDRQALEAARMTKVYDDAVSKGYTAGINHAAREVLVDGWKRYFTALQPPKKGDAAAEPAPAPPGR